MSAAILRDAAVIPHHPEPAFGHDDIERLYRRPVAGVQVRALVQRDSIHAQPATRITATHPITWQPDDSLDVVLLPLGAEAEPAGDVIERMPKPAVGGRLDRRLCAIERVITVEHDYFAALDVADPVHRLVDQYSGTGL